jgi:hypothetical protein
MSLNFAYAIKFPEVESKIFKPNEATFFLSAIDKEKFLAVSENTLFLFKGDKILWQFYFSGDFVDAKIIEREGEFKIALATKSTLFLINSNGDIIFRKNFEGITSIDLKNDFLVLSTNFPLLLNISETETFEEEPFEEIKRTRPEAKLNLSGIIWKKEGVEMQNVKIADNGILGSSLVETLFLDFNGNVLWRKNLVGKIEVFQEKIIIASKDGIYIFDNFGNIIAKFDIKLENPEISLTEDKILLLDQKGELYMIDKNTLKISEKKVVGNYLSKITKLNEHFLVSDFGCNCVKHFDSSGRIFWSLKIPEPILTAPLYLEKFRKIFVGTNKGIYVIADGKNKPPKAFFTSPRIAYTNQEVNFDGSMSNDPEGMDLTYEWFVDNAKVGTNSPFLSYSFVLPGFHSVSLKVKDPANSESFFEYKIEVLPGNSAPQVWATASYIGNGEYSLQAFVKDKDNDEVDVRWDFDNDGKFEVGWGKTFTITRKFNENSTANVLIEAKDSKGNINSTLLKFKTWVETKQPYEKSVDKGSGSSKFFLLLIVLGLILILFFARSFKKG